MMLLIEAMRLAPSCNNNQPWRVVVAKDRESLEKIKVAMSRGNMYAKNAPLIFAVCARYEDDCHLSDRREYFLFGCGLAVGEMMLQATALGLVAHAIAGFDPLMVKKNLNIPDDYVLIALVNIGYPERIRRCSLINRSRRRPKDRKEADRGQFLQGELGESAGLKASAMSR